MSNIAIFLSSYNHLENNTPLQYQFRCEILIVIQPTEHLQ